MRSSSRWLAGGRAAEHLLGGVGQVEKAILILVVPVQLLHGDGHVRQPFVVHQQVEGLGGGQAEPRPAERKTKAACKPRGIGGGSLVGTRCWLRYLVVPLKGTKLRHRLPRVPATHQHPQVRRWVRGHGRLLPKTSVRAEPQPQALTSIHPELRCQETSVLGRDFKQSTKVSIGCNSAACLQGC